MLISLAGSRKAQHETGQQLLNAQHTHMNAAGMEHHGHGPPIGHLPIEASDLCFDQVHERLTLCADPTATSQHCQSAARNSGTAFSASADGQQEDLQKLGYAVKSS